MAANWYGPGLKALLEDGASNLTLEVMLLKSTVYSFDKDHDSISGDGLDTAECDATNYVRKAATVTLEYDATNDRVELDIADLTWTSLGGASNNTLAVAVLYIDVDTTDANAIPVLYLDFTPTATDGNNFVVDFDQTDGNGRIAV